MTEEELKALRKQLDALAPATWTRVVRYLTDDGLCAAQGPQRINEDDAVRDAYFIASAPENIRLLLDEVERLRKQNDQLMAQINIESDVQYAQRCTIENLQAKLDAVPVAAINTIMDEGIDDFWKEWDDAKVATKTVNEWLVGAQVQP